MMQIVVPAGVVAGQPFMVNTPSGLMQVVCPPGVKAGDPMQVNVPLPATTVVAAPVQPVAMGVVLAE